MILLPIGLVYNKLSLDMTYSLEGSEDTAVQPLQLKCGVSQQHKEALKPYLGSNATWKLSDNPEYLKKALATIGH